MPFILANNIVTHYRISGVTGKPRMVLLNSLGTDFRIWDDVVHHLKDDFEILSYDKRGHGLTEDDNKQQTIALLAQDIIALLDELGWTEPVIFAGLSVGGLITQYIGVHFADRAKALVLMDTAAKIGTQDSWNMRIEAVRQNGISAIGDAIMQRWFTPFFASQRAVDYKGYTQMLERTSAKGYAGTCAALRDCDLSQDVQNIACPVQVIAGDQDASTPPNLVENTAKLIPSARFALIANAGHLPCIEQPALLAKMIQTFIADL